MDAMTGRDSAVETDSAYAWRRLACTGLMSTIGGVGMWSFIVALPAVQADFGITRAEASLPYTLLLLGFAVGGVFMGRLADHRGIVPPLLIAITSLGAGYVLSGFATSIWQLALVHGILMGLCGTSVMFGPLIADISHWFVRRRGIAISVAASGNYLAGTIWPPILQAMITSIGWRQAYMIVGVFCVVTMLPLVLALRRRPAVHALGPTGGGGAARQAGGPRPRPDGRGRGHRARIARHVAERLDGAALGRGPRVLRRDVDAAGAYRRVLRRPRLRRRARCRDAVADARLRRCQPRRLRFHRRSYRRAQDIARRLGAADLRPGSLSRLRRAAVALSDLGAIRPGARRHRAGPCHDRARILPAGRGGLAGRHRDHGDPGRDGVRRLDVGGDLRSHRLLPRGLRQWRGVECAQRRDRRLAPDPGEDDRRRTPRAGLSVWGRSSAITAAPFLGYLLVGRSLSLPHKETSARKMSAADQEIP